MSANPRQENWKFFLNFIKFFNNLNNGFQNVTFTSVGGVTVDEHCNWLIRVYGGWAELEERLTLGLNITKNAIYMKKNLKQKLLRIQFRTKNSVGAHVYLSPEQSKGTQKITMFEII